ncbi:MAG: hypothetical protein D6717_10515 [Gammaproteobacteria bacterium]|nr:MAG: hypothetical protein D6717_10515 [Gammaproteobacteria bacterium]
MALGFAWTAAVTAAELVAPVYPGAVHAPEYDTGRFEAWLSKDAPERVSAWYRQALRKAPVEAAGKHDWFVVLTQQEVGRILQASGGHWTEAVEAGVDVRRHPLATHGADVERTRRQVTPCRSDHFLVLRDLVNRGKGSQEEFDRLCGAYAWIEHAYYRLHDPGGLRQPMDQYLLAQARQRLTGGAGQSAMDAEALGRRMQELAQQGRLEEAARLAQQFQGAHGASAELPADAWEQWVAHLKRVADNAYRTMIRIHKHPSRWTDRPVGEAR